jgi:MFS family permease
MADVLNDSVSLPRAAPGRQLLSLRQRRRNVGLLGIVLAIFMMASGLIGPLTLVPLFVSKLIPDPLAIGALTAAFQLGWLPQLLVVGYYERSAHKRTWLLLFGVLERLPTFGLTIAALLASSAGLPLVLGLIYLSRFLQSLAAGLGATSWLDYVGRSVPPGGRGRFMGTFTPLGNLLGAGAAASAALLLAHFPFPYSFALCFGLGFGLLALSWLPLLWLVEPPEAARRAPRPLRQQLGELPLVVRTDRGFRRFLLGLSCLALGTMGDAFLVVYAVTRLGAPDDLAAFYAVTLLVGQLLANVGLGRLADRSGFAAVARLSGLAQIGLATVALLAPSALWLVLAFALLGAAQAGSLLARLTGPLEYAPPGRGPTYTALTMALTSLVAAGAPLLGSLLVAWLGYQALFVVALTCGLAANLVLRRPGGRLSKPQGAG